MNYVIKLFAALLIAVSVCASSAPRPSVSVITFGAKCDGSNDDTAAIAKANSDMPAAGGVVRIPHGSVCKLTAQLAIKANVTFLAEPGAEIQIATTGAVDAITIANGAALVGQGYGSNQSKITVLSGASIARIVTNADKTGAQQYAVFEGFNVVVNNGATVSQAAVDFVSVFAQSRIKDVSVNCNDICGPAIRVASLGVFGLGPIVLENLWALNSTANGIDIIDVAASGASAVWMRNITTEHQASGFHGLRLLGVNGLLSTHLIGFHYENSKAFGAAGAAIYVDGVSLIGDDLQVWSAPTGNKKGVWIANNARNLRIQLRGITNGNSVNPILQDDLNGITYAAINLPYYATPDVGVVTTTEQTLTYGVTVSIDMSKGNYCLLDVTNGVGFTISNPTNTGAHTKLYIEMSNSSGGALGVVTLGGNFVYVDANGLPAGKPANGKRRLYVYERRAATNTWVQVSVTGDM